MSRRCGPLLIAISSVLVRLAGDPGIADMLAMGYLAALTATLSRTELRPAARVAGSCARLHHTRPEAPTYSIAH
jgi:hypothetical protein